MDEGFRLETERLLLRPYRLEDLDDLHAMFSDPEHMRWYRSRSPEGTQSGSSVRSPDTRRAVGPC